MDLTCSSCYAAFQGDVFLMLDIKRLIDVVIMVFVVVVVVGIMMMALLMIEFFFFFVIIRCSPKNFNCCACFFFT